MISGQFGGREGLIAAIAGNLLSIRCDLGEECVEDSFEFSSDVSFRVDVFLQMTPDSSEGISSISAKSTGVAFNDRMLLSDVLVQLRSR